MELSAADRKDLIDSIARQIIEQLGIDFEDLVHLPITFVAQAAGISTTQVGRILPVTEFGAHNKRVPLTEFRKYLAENTTYPKGSKPRPLLKPASAA